MRFGDEDCGINRNIIRDGQVKDVERRVAIRTRNHGVGIDTALGQGAAIPSVLAASGNVIRLGIVIGIECQTSADDAVATRSYGGQRIIQDGVA